MIALGSMKALFRSFNVVHAYDLQVVPSPQKLRWKLVEGHIHKGCSSFVRAVITANMKWVSGRTATEGFPSQSSVFNNLA